MQVFTKRAFISAHLGNVSENKVLDVSDAYGKHLIENGLATEVLEAAKPSGGPESKDPGFTTPAANAQAPGLSSPAAPASKPRTAKKSNGGGKKKDAKKDTSR